jgi:N-acetyl-anhydromuramyl-L-alanine amidase AmpD
MPITWHPVPNFWPGRGGERVRAVCLHVSEGSRDSMLHWFSDPASDASAHYLVNKDGSVWQFVREEDTAWANGEVRNPDRGIPWLDDCLRRGQNPNRLTVSVETERRWQEPLAAPQHRALVDLLRGILARHALPADRQHLVPHSAIDGVNRAHCPGNLDWERLLADLAAPAAARTFPATGQTVRGPFLAFWLARGGLPIFGYPLTPERREGTLTVQWFERARFELHPGNVVMLGRVGAELLAATRR